MRPTRKLTDSRCQCSGCNEYFNSDTAFDMHRTGEFGKDRRCMTPAEMLKAGMAKNADDWWITEPYDGWAREPREDAQDALEGNG
jgi:hypothetical protein